MSNYFRIFEYPLRLQTLKKLELMQTSTIKTRLFLCIPLFVFVFLFPLSLKSQAAPKRELRGVWIASVLNIDYPSVPTTSEYILKDEWIKLLDKHKALGINALYVQIRPVADAFYKSELTSWSRYLTGQSGIAPANDFDPLPFMIQTAHDRGFEFHAWLNPYRASMDNQEPSSFSPNHVMNQHPEWCIKYGKRYIMNPGLPEVRAHVNQIVAEIVTKYDVDGIHFDDYFYPYKIAGQSFPDAATFQQYNNGFTNLEDWRRNNVDLLIYNLAKTIKAIKPRVQFGISPFGVWRNNAKDPEGSATQAGLTCYDDLYADVRKWLRESWIDYATPQVYWQIGFSIAEHATIVKWWVDNSAGKPIYIGLGAYRVGQASTREPAWTDPAEIGRQIQLSRSYKEVKGVVYFSSKSLTNNLLGIGDTLTNNYYRYPAIPPQVFKDTSLLECDAPELRQVIAENNRAIIKWKPSRRTVKRQPFQYIIYRFDNHNVDFTDGKNIRTIIQHDEKDLMYVDKNVMNDVSYTYAVTVVDCQHRETPAEDTITLGKPYKLHPPPPSRVDVHKNNQKEVKKKKRGFWSRLFGCKK